MNHFLASSREAEGLVAEPSEVSEKLQIHKTYPAIPENSIIRQLVSNFGSKLKLSQSLSTTSFQGGQHSSDSYYVLLKLALLCSAVEGWERLIGKGQFSVLDQELARSLASDPAWKHFREKLLASITSQGLKNSLQAFYDLESFDLMPILTAIRHAFFHPGLTATNSNLVAKPKLRQLLLQIYAQVEKALLESFESWSKKIQSWHELATVGDDELIETALKLDLAAGYPRAAVETEFRTKLNDQQWRILISELLAEDEFEIEETITDVISNMDSYLAEHEGWENKINSMREEPKE